jgi:carbon storage regulator
MEGEIMLVLTRKAGEAVAIGDSIRIKIVEIKEGQVRIGIEAPADQRILREEILVKVRKENMSAAEWDLMDFNKVIESLPGRKSNV